MTCRRHSSKDVSNDDAGTGTFSESLVRICAAVSINYAFTFCVLWKRIRQMQNEMALLRDLKGNKARHIDAVLRCEIIISSLFIISEIRLPESINLCVHVPMSLFLGARGGIV